MLNYSSYSVFLHYNIVRGLCWSLGLVSLPCNIIIIAELLLLNYHKSKTIFTKYLIVNNRYRLLISRNPSIFLLFNLSLGDLVSSLYLVILAISDSSYTNHYRNKYGPYPNYSSIENEWIISPTCTMERILSQLSLVISISMTFIVAVDRYILVVFPHSRRKITIKDARVVATIFWLLGFIVAFTIGLLSAHGATVHHSTRFDILGQFCNTDSSKGFMVLAVLYIELFLGFSMHTTSMILYIIICMKLKQSRSLFKSNSSSRIEKRVSLILASVVFTNVFTYLPIMIFSILGQFIPNYKPEETDLFPTLVLLLYLNAAVNPVLFMVLSANFESKRRGVAPSSDIVTSRGRLNTT
ncbi:G-protein coupled receptor GRL101-like protein [Trichoplax sp. H2]|nr:G-protein coupled receptor GRL101-like protein [Trichoplax sp. H2]|eukprot:RDD39100.1 G-protein coupled receptor GRL101-like protein [Trichoplax sp. H2]